MMSIDIIGLIEAFYLYVLPPVVLVVVIGSFFRASKRLVSTPRPEDEESALRFGRLARERTVRRIGLLNYGLALRALVMVIPEFQGYFLSGNFSSIAILNIGVPLVVAAMNAPIGVGLRYLRPWARWAEVAWNILFGVLALLLFFWHWHHGATVPLAEWPEIALSKVLPLFLLLVMLSRGTSRVVSAEHRALIAKTPDLSKAPAPPSVVSSLTLGFLVIVGSVLIVNTLDWGIRIRPELNESLSTSP